METMKVVAALDALGAEAGSARARQEMAQAATAAARARVRAERSGFPLPDSAEVLAELREERP